jgi:hypothetical protein
MAINDGDELLGDGVGEGVGNCFSSSAANREFEISVRGASKFSDCFVEAELSDFVADRSSRGGL